MVKKNNQRVVGYGRGRRVIYPVQYQAWERDAAYQIIDQKKGYTLPIDGPIEVHYEFHFKNHQAEADTSNLIEGIQDVLQKMNVITNDKNIVALRAKKLFGLESKVLVKIIRPLSLLEDNE